MIGSRPTNGSHRLISAQSSLGLKPFYVAVFEVSEELLRQSLQIRHEAWDASPSIPGPRVSDHGPLVLG